MAGIARQQVDARLKRVLPRAGYRSVKAVYRRGRALAGRNPGRGRLLPDFLIIGAPRCGTTSLFTWLTEHPFVAATPKEIHFFNLHYEWGTDWYRQHFPLEQEREAFAHEHGRPFLVCEGTASYLAHHRTPERMARLLPNARLIVSLRDPVDRAHSAYQVRRANGPAAEPLATFEEAVAAEEERLRGEEARERGDPHYDSWRTHRWGYLRRSRYAEQLERWFSHFPREQFLLFTFQELIGDPKATLERIYEHVGLPRYEHGALPAMNGLSYDPIAPETRERLNEYFAPHNERLRELTGIDLLGMGRQLST